MQVCVGGMSRGGGDSPGGGEVPRGPRLRLEKRARHAPRALPVALSSLHPWSTGRDLRLPLPGVAVGTLPHPRAGPGAWAQRIQCRNGPEDLAGAEQGGEEAGAVWVPVPSGSGVSCMGPGGLELLSGGKAGGRGFSVYLLSHCSDWGTLPKGVAPVCVYFNHCFESRCHFLFI